MTLPPSDSGSRETPAPRRVGRYELRGHLGSGAMGDVYLAWDPGAGREVALKTRRGGSAERFVREAQLMASLDHPGIVRVLDAGVDSTSGVAYYACERVEGAWDLRQAFAGLTLWERVEYVRDAARAAGHAHARGIVHRDLKPENVLVDSRGTVRITDFGLAIAEELERLTRTGALLGTPTHLAPEQWKALQGERIPVDPRSDVWALGVVLYEALTGELPFEGSSWMELSSRILQGSVTAPSAVNPEVPRALQRVCLSALARDPDQRPEDGTALADRIEAALSEEGGRSWVPLGAVAACLALGASGLALATLAGPGATPSPTSARSVASLAPTSEPSAEGAHETSRGSRGLLAQARAEREAGEFAAALKTLAALNAATPEVARLRAQTLCDLGRPREALRELDQALKVSPDDVKLLVDRGRLRLSQGQGVSAIEDMERALQLAPDDVSSLMLKARVLASRGEDETALLLVEAQLSKHPEEAEVWVSRAGLLLRAGKRDLSLKDVANALQIDPRLGRAYSVRASIYIDLKDNLRATEAVQRGLEVDPGNAELWTNCGVIRMRSGNLMSALEALDRALEIHPGRALALANRGFVHKELGRREEAVRDFRLALRQLGPKSRARGPIIEAIRTLEQEARLATASLNPKEALAEATRLRDAGSPELALGIVERVLSEEPENLRALYLHGNLLVLRGRPQQAIEVLTRVIERDPTRREHFNDRGLAYQGLGKEKLAIADFDRVIKGWPEYARGWSNRAISRRKSGDLEGALADCNQALKLEPSYPNGLVNRANVFIGLKRLSEAEADCDQALALQPLGFVHGLRGMIRQERGNLEGAEADYLRFQELASPTDPRRPRIEALLRGLRARRR